MNIWQEYSVTIISIYMAKMNLTQKFFLTIAVIGTIALFTVKPQALAQDQRLTIVPPKFELFGNPGDTLTELIKVRNDSTVPQTYSLLVEDFTTSGE